MKRTRIWCQDCNDFTIHCDSICKCGKTYVTTLVRDIPNDKLLEQQERFKAQRKRKSLERFNAFTSMLDHGRLLYDLFGEVKAKQFHKEELEIWESDGGLQAIEERENELRRKIHTERMDELEIFKSVQRNEKCYCGSDLKYKKCCLRKHESWGK